MIAIDTSSLVAYCIGDLGPDVEHADLAFSAKTIVLPPVVLSEFLGAKKIVPSDIVKLVKELPLLDIVDGYWERAGLLRAHVLKKNLKARIADSLIAQSCLDHRVPLITRDRDFRHFVPFGLKLIG